MQEVIESRELFTLNCLGAVVRGTHHRGGEDAADSGRMGVVILNSLSPTRAGAGDSAVYLAESLAEFGYPVFRLDLPGFGDSEGNPPAELLKVINTGGYGPTAAALIKELSQRFSLSGVVIMGLCAGALSAIYSAACASRRCKGLVLIDPYFHLPLPDRSWLWQKLTGRISRTAPGRVIENVFGRLTDLRLRFRRNALPQNANAHLLKCWKSVASTGLPILLFKAPNVKTRGEEFDYLKYALEQAGSGHRVVIKVIAGAGHTFSNRVGKTAVQHHTKEWLEACFPLHRDLSPVANGNKLYHLDYLHQ
jgi:pimeloyl-ACP methyl ester carboxylesterase